MIPPVKLVRPQNLSAALRTLAQYGERARPIAGGTDVLPGFHQGSPRFVGIKALVDIHHLPELRAIKASCGGLSIGAAVTFGELAVHPLVRCNYPLLAEAAASIGSWQVRNRATLGGNFVNNAPCADSVPPLLVYDSEIRIRSQNGERSLLLGDFLLEPYRTQLRADEIVTEILLPAVPEGYKSAYYKLGRRQRVAVSRITLAMLLKLHNKRIADLRIASGAVTPIGMRFPKLEAVARGRKAGADFMKELAQDLGRQVLEVTGLRWSTPYKLPVLQQMFYQMLCGLCAGL